MRAESPILAWGRHVLARAGLGVVDGERPRLGRFGRLGPRLERISPSWNETANTIRRCAVCGAGVETRALPPGGVVGERPTLLWRSTCLFREICPQLRRRRRNLQHARVWSESG